MMLDYFRMIFVKQSSSPQLGRGVPAAGSRGVFGCGVGHFCRMLYDSHMDWYGFSYRKKGGMIGAFCAVFGFFVSFFVCVKLLIIDGWTGITNTSGNSIGNIVGWISLYTVLALIISAVIFVGLLLTLFSLGSFIGWCYGKMR